MNICSINLQGFIRNNKFFSNKLPVLQMRFKGSSDTDEFKHSTIPYVTDEDLVRIKAKIRKEILCGELTGNYSRVPIEQIVNDRAVELSKERAFSNSTRINQSNFDDMNEIQRKIRLHSEKPLILERDSNGNMIEVDDVDIEKTRANLFAKLYTTEPEKILKFLEDLAYNTPEIFAELSENDFISMKMSINSSYFSAKNEDLSTDEQLEKLKSIAFKLFNKNPEAFAKYFAIKRENTETPFIDDNNPINSIKSFIKNIFQPK